MKKSLHLSVLLICVMCVSLIGTTYAQTNLNVESWTANGLGGEDPDGWGTLNGFMAFGFPQTTFKETADPGEGLASVRMTSTYLPGASGAGAPSDTVGAMLFLGFYNLVTSDNGIAYTSKPVSVDFMYKSLPQGSDSGMVLVTLTHWDAGLGTTMTDGFASMMFGSQVTSWTTASMPIIWISGDTPDTLNIIATSSAIMLNDDTTYQMPGSELYLDSFAIVLPVVNTAPVANDDVATTDSGVAVTIDVQSNDTDAEGGSMTTNVTSGPSNGTAILVNSVDIQYTPAVGFIGNDTIWYELCDNGSPALCDTAMVVITVVSPTGIESVVSHSKFVLYPNPVALEILNIEMSFDGEATFKIFDMLGKQINGVTLKEDLNQVNVSGLSKGTYMYQITDKRGTVLANGNFTVAK